MINNRPEQISVSAALLTASNQLVKNEAESKRMLVLNQTYDQLENYSMRERFEDMSNIVIQRKPLKSQSIMQIKTRTRKSYAVLSNSLLGSEEPNAFHLILTHAPRPKEKSAWEVLNSLIGTVTAPADWSLKHDHYLYGTSEDE
jgi:hypothetical protein